MAKHEEGYIVVEAVGAFMLFTFMIVSILSLIGIVTVQARVHYALTQACETVSMYGYILDLTGAASHIQNNSAKAASVQDKKDKFEENLEGLLNGIEEIDADQIGEKGEALVNQVMDETENMLDDPEKMVKLLLNYGLDQAGSELFEPLVRSLIGRYLANGRLDGNQYLLNYGVVDGLGGLEFSRLGGHNSELLNGDGNVKLVVQYDVKYQFGALPMPFDRLHVTQEVMTKAWLGGEGKGYSG